MEERIFADYRRRGDEIRGAIDRARQLDLSGLPEKLGNSVGESFAKAEMTFTLVDDIRQAGAAVDGRGPDFRPLHRQVRQTQRDMARLEERIAEIRTTIGRISGDDESALRRRQALGDAVSDMETEQQALAASIPDVWEAEQQAYRQLLRAEQKGRTLYRRNVDAAYKPIQEAIAAIGAAGQLAAVRTEIEGLRDIIESLPPKEAAEKIAAVRSLVGDVAGTSALRSEIGKVRRALTGRTPDQAKAQQALKTTLGSYEAELAWRLKAEQDLLPALRSYEAAIRSTIGLRQQPELPKDAAIEIAGCLAYHRDISLNF